MLSNACNALLNSLSIWVTKYTGCRKRWICKPITVPGDPVQRCFFIKQKGYVVKSNLRDPGVGHWRKPEYNRTRLCNFKIDTGRYFKYLYPGDLLQMETEPIQEFHEISSLAWRLIKHYLKATTSHPPDLLLP